MDIAYLGDTLKYACPKIRDATPTPQQTHSPAERFIANVPIAVLEFLMQRSRDPAYHDDGPHRAKEWDQLQPDHARCNFAISLVNQLHRAVQCQQEQNVNEQREGDDYQNADQHAE